MFLRKRVSSLFSINCIIRKIEKCVLSLLFLADGKEFALEGLFCSPCFLYHLDKDGVFREDSMRVRTQSFLTIKISRGMNNLFLSFLYPQD